MGPILQVPWASRKAFRLRTVCRRRTPCTTQDTGLVKTGVYHRASRAKRDINPRGSKYPIVEASGPIKGMVLGARVFKYWVLGPFGNSLRPQRPPQTSGYYILVQIVGRTAGFGGLQGPKQFRPMFVIRPWCQIPQTHLEMILVLSWVSILALIWISWSQFGGTLRSLRE